MATGQKRHIELHRKLLLRKALLADALPGAVYVPFCGDGDIAAALYPERPIWAADLDPARVETFRQRLPDATVAAADCDSWPFPGEQTPFAVADFDSYSYPYASFRAWWAEAQRAARVVLFFTDSVRLTLRMREESHWRHPDGTTQATENANERRALFNAWLSRTVKPWFEQHIAPWQVLRYRSYLRNNTLYWGAIVQDPAAAELPALRSQAAERGRTKLTPKRQAEYLAHLASGMRRGTAAEAIGVDSSTIRRYRLNNPEFRLLEDAAEVEACDPVEDALYQAATSGNVDAIKHWLSHRSPERWPALKQHTEVTGKDGGPILTRDVSAMSDEELQALVDGNSPR